jgi:hypothetical protein
VADLTAFLDESKKPVRDPATGRPLTTGDHYVVASAVVLHGDVDEVRSEVSDVERTLGYRLHYANLRSRKRRLEAVEALGALSHWDGYLFETARPVPASVSEHHVRAKVLQEAMLHLANEVGVLRLHLETRADPKRGFHVLDEKDNQVLQRLLSQKAVPADLRIAHFTKSEAVLCIADVLAGARSDYLCGADRETYSLLAHRVRDTRQALGVKP